MELTRSPGSSFPKIELNFKLISLRGSSGGGSRSACSVRIVQLLGHYPLEKARGEERLIKLLKKLNAKVYKPRNRREILRVRIQLDLDGPSN